jgi:hypothetical protein
MEFFDRMLVLAERIEGRIAQHCMLCYTGDPLPHHRYLHSDDVDGTAHAISNVSTSLHRELTDIRTYLATFHARLRGDLGISTQYGDNSGGLVHFLASIHNSLHDVLQSIIHEHEKESTLVGRPREWDPLGRSSLVDNITIEHQKLRVLICAFNPYVLSSATSAVC